MIDLTGQTVGPYNIIEPLGQGGMAVLYRTFDTRLERDVAIKFTRTDMIAATLHDQMLKRFEREAKAMAKMKHPHIVAIYDYGEYQGTPYLVMEYFPGDTLKQLTGAPMAVVVTHHRSTV